MSFSRELDSLLAAADEAYRRARWLVFDRVEPRQVFDETSLNEAQQDALEELRVVEQAIRDYRARAYADLNPIPEQVTR